MPIERVVTTAVQLVDEVGPVDFSMRLLAQRLRSSTATLYRNFASKDEILVHVIDHILGEVPQNLTDEVDPPTWQTQLVAIADALFRTLQAHPAVVPLLNQHIPLGPNGLAARENAMEIMLSSGLPLETAARAYTAIGHYVIGFASQLGANWEDRAAADREVHNFYRSLDPVTYPATVASSSFLPTSLEDEFRFGLQLLVGGLATQMSVAEPTRRPRARSRVG
jgi:AcrR family transcriptional regulator